MRPTGFEPATVGFGVQRSTVGATPSSVDTTFPPHTYSVQTQKYHHYFSSVYIPTDCFELVLTLEIYTFEKA